MLASSAWKSDGCRLEGVKLEAFELAGLATHGVQGVQHTESRLPLAGAEWLVATADGSTATGGIICSFKVAVNPHCTCYKEAVRALKEEAPSNGH